MLTVVGYGRVSTDDDDQLNSLKNQTRFFSEYINKNPDWIFGGIYADEGITGTNTRKRDQFKKMIGDALSGNINLIITKEVSRFARNTVDTLYYVRLLKSNGVGVIFINDNIDSRDKDGEFRLTIMASVAQEESRKTSERVKWGQKRQMEKGFVFGSGPFGYQCKKGVLEVKEEEAEIVRDIFNKYVYEQKGISVIAKELIDKKVKVGGRIEKWRPQTIARILKNEKYVGDLITQKTVITDFLEHKQECNKGQEKQLYFRDHHEPIINRETWELARKEYNMRSKMVKDKSKYSNRYWCSGKVKCGECGSNCVTRTSPMKNSRWRAWQCSQAYTYGKTKFDISGGKIGCNNKVINEKILISCVQFAFKYIKILEMDILKEMEDEIKHFSNKNNLVDEKKALLKDIKNTKNKKEELIDLYLEKKVTEAEFNSMKFKYNELLILLEERLNKIDQEIKLSSKSEINSTIIMNHVKHILLNENPTVELYSIILDKIILYENHDLDIYFKYISEPICIHYQTAGKGESYRALCNIRK